MRITKGNICKTCGIRGIYNFKGSQNGIACKIHKQKGMINIMEKRICEKDICISQRPQYNFEGETKGRFCKIHKEPGMENIINKRCKECKSISPSFNYKGKKPGEFCSEHKKPGMVNVKHKQCEETECINTNPSFNFEGEKKGRFCSKHKKPDMVNVLEKRKCQKDYCRRQPCFNFEGETKGIYCKKHKDSGMVNVTEKRRCEDNSCNSQKPCYNFIGETKGRFCDKHKKPGMVNIISKHCQFLGCPKINPAFNFFGVKGGIFCSDHKKPGMVNVINKTCNFEGCLRQPSFNFKDDTIPIFCCEHKESNMIDVINIRCEFESGCNKINPIFNFQGENRGKFCCEHKKPGMVNVQYKKCIVCNEVSAGFGYCCSNKTHCAKHKDKYMIKNPYSICTFEHCENDAIYGISKPEHCDYHKKEDDICWLIKQCENCKRSNEILNNKNMCIFCADIPFFENNKKREKIKEYTMIDYLRKNIDKKETLSDRIIDSTCNSYRPDLLYDCDTHIVVIECDEYQHKNYIWESCASNRNLKQAEEKRMYAISQAYGLPSIFLRWNPDTFRVNDNIVKKYQTNKRLEILKKWIEYCFNMEKVEGINYKNLFYDNYDESDLSFINISENNII